MDVGPFVSFVLISLLRILTKSSLSFMLASFIYCIVYRIYIPNQIETFPLSFDYHDSSAIKSESINLNTVSSPKKGVLYDAILIGNVPDIDYSILRPTMISLNICCDEHCNLVSQTPLLIPYRSGVTRYLRSLFFWWFIFLGFKDESFPIAIFLKKALAISSQRYESCISTTFSIELDSPVSIFKARLLFVAHFQGIRYFMYHWRLLSAFFVIFTIWALTTFSAMLMELIRLFLFYKNSAYQYDIPPEEKIVYPQMQELIVPKEITDNLSDSDSLDDLVPEISTGAVDDTFDATDEGLPLLFGDQ